MVVPDTTGGSMQELKIASIFFDLGTHFDEPIEGCLNASFGEGLPRFQNGLMYLRDQLTDNEFELCVRSLGKDDQNRDLLPRFSRGTRPMPEWFEEGKTKKSPITVERFVQVVQAVLNKREK